MGRNLGEIENQFGRNWFAKSTNLLSNFAQIGLNKKINSVMISISLECFSLPSCIYWSGFSTYPWYSGTSEDIIAE